MYFADAGQHIEHRLFVDHNAPHTKSNVNYKGALQGHGAHAVWIGDVLIRKEAEGIETYEENRNLVLTDGCQRRLGAQPRDRDRRDRGRRPRVGDRPLRRQPAVLPALARHRGGRGPAARRARLLRRPDPPDRRTRARGAAHRRRSRPSWRRTYDAFSPLPARLQRRSSDSTPHQGRRSTASTWPSCATATRSSRSRTSAPTPTSRSPRVTSRTAPSSASCTARASTCAPASRPAPRPPNPCPSSPSRSTATTCSSTSTHPHRRMN